MKVGNARALFFQSTGLGMLGKWGKANIKKKHRKVIVLPRNIVVKSWFSRKLLPSLLRQEASSSPSTSPTGDQYREQVGNWLNEVFRPSLDFHFKGFLRHGVLHISHFGRIGLACFLGLAGLKSGCTFGTAKPSQVRQQLNEKLQKEALRQAWDTDVPTNPTTG